MKLHALILILTGISIAHNQAATRDFPVCALDPQTHEVTGNYNAIQVQAYTPSCQFNIGAPQDSEGLYVVPIGNNRGGHESRVRYFAAGTSARSIEMSLQDATDNSLSHGGRGRQEVANCFVSAQAFYELPAEEREFRQLASDYYRSCTRTSGREITYTFSLKLEDSTSTPTFQDWDSIVMQLHALNDKDHFCMPHHGTPAMTCNQHNGRLGRVGRNPQSYTRLRDAGAVFEKDLQPPVSFRLKGGHFMIVVSSSLVDANGTPTTFSPAQNCSQNVTRAMLGIEKTCHATGKTTAVLYRAALGQPPLPLNTFIHFRVSVKWPDMRDASYRLKVETLDPLTAQPTLLVDNTTVRFGSHDELYPYFKAGVYRLNSNATPMKVTLQNLSISVP